MARARPRFRVYSLHRRGLIGGTRYPRGLQASTRTYYGSRLQMEIDNYYCRSANPRQRACSVNVPLFVLLRWLNDLSTYAHDATESRHERGTVRAAHQRRTAQTQPTAATTTSGPRQRDGRLTASTTPVHTSTIQRTNYVRCARQGAW